LAGSELNLSPALWRAGVFQLKKCSGHGNFDKKTIQLCNICAKSDCLSCL